MLRPKSVTDRFPWKKSYTTNMLKWIHSIGQLLFRKQNRTASIMTCCNDCFRFVSIIIIVIIIICASENALFNGPWVWQLNFNTAWSMYSVILLIVIFFSGTSDVIRLDSLNPIVVNSNMSHLHPLWQHGYRSLIRLWLL